MCHTCKVNKQKCYKQYAYNSKCTLIFFNIVRKYYVSKISNYEVIETFFKVIFSKSF